MTVITAPKWEARAAGTDLAVEDGKLRGSILFGVKSRPFSNGVTEVIDPGALDETDLSDLVATVNHDPSRLLGRYASTLRLEPRSDGSGVDWEVDLPDSPLGADVREAVKRGDMRGSSFLMQVGKDRWEGRTRHVQQIKSLRDVTVATFPVYGDSGLELRSDPPTPPEPPAPDKPATQDEGVRHNQEDPAMPDKPDNGGGLALESRAADQNPDFESRLFAAMRAVPKGEARDLTHATIDSDPIEPADLATHLWDKLRDHSVLLATGIPVFTTTRKKMTWPTLTKDIVAGFVGELELIPESDPELDEFGLEPKALKALTRGSSEAFEDSADPSLMEIVQNNMLAAMALKFDAEGLSGGSSKGFPGILKWANTLKLDMAEGALESYDALIAAVGLLAAKNVPAPYVIVAHPYVTTALDRLTVYGTAESNEPLPRPAGLPPIYTSGQVPIKAGTSGKPDTSPILVYSPSQLAAVRRKEATIEVSREAEFDTDAVLVRGKARAVLGTATEEAVVIVQNVKTPAITL
jgi:HK97 family phage major capsid protein/HK97 family phage prohead protease